jgi:hypothetical protein
MATVSTSSNLKYMSSVVDGRASSDVVQINSSMTCGCSILASSRKNMKEDGIQSIPSRGALHHEIDIWALPWIESYLCTLSFTPNANTSFGGKGPSGPYDDLWVYDTISNSWTEPKCEGTFPPAREGHAGTVIDGILWIFGGKSRLGSVLSDLWALDLRGKIIGMYHSF